MRTPFRVLSAQPSRPLHALWLSLVLARRAIRVPTQVRAAEALGEYTRLFRLYKTAPGHCPYVLETFADRVRLDALKVMLKGYTPSVPTDYVRRCLGFDTESDAAFYVEDHGGVLSGDDRASVDCKASRAGLVDHSISAKLEEEQKDAQRKAEIIPITF